MFRQVRTWDLTSPGFDAMGRLRSCLASLSAKFGSWKASDEDDDILCGADPQLVAALEFVASLLPDKETE